jgi:hypothetical protein
LSKQKADPYYLQDGRRDSDDLAAIPVVKLDLGLSTVAAADGEPSTGQRKTKKKKAKATEPPPVIDLDGEMPEGAVVGSSTFAPAEPPARKSDDVLRLADIKLDLGGGRSSDLARQSSKPSPSTRPKGGFVEYDEGDAEPPVPAPAAASTTPRSETPEAAPPAAEAEGIEIVRVVKKKKKPRPEGASTVRRSTSHDRLKDGRTPH